MRNKVSLKDSSSGAFTASPLSATPLSATPLSATPLPVAAAAKSECTVLPPACASGYHSDSNGDCVSDVSVHQITVHGKQTCSAGLTSDGEGGCVSRAYTEGKTSNCPSG